MRIEVRVYKQYDLDLFALAGAGYSLSRLLEKAVTSFAHGRPVYFIMDEINDFSIQDTLANIRFHYFINNKDTETTGLLKSVAPRMKSTFSKAILRNALGQQNLRCFFPGFPDIDRLMMIDRNQRLLASRPDTIPLSSFRVQQNIKVYGGTKIDMAVKDTGRRIIQDTADAQYNTVLQQPDGGMQYSSQWQQSQPYSPQMTGTYQQMPAQQQMPQQPVLNFGNSQQPQSINPVQNADTVYRQPAPQPVQRPQQSVQYQAPAQQIQPVPVSVPPQQQAMPQQNMMQQPVPQQMSQQTPVQNTAPAPAPEQAPAQQQMQQPAQPQQTKQPAPDPEMQIGDSAQAENTQAPGAASDSLLDAFDNL